MTPNNIKNNMTERPQWNVKRLINATLVAGYQSLGSELQLETDAPFLAPIPLRGQRNEPAHVIHTAAALAALRGISPQEVATITTANFKNLVPTTR